MADSLWNFDAIPAELKLLPNWVTWREEIRDGKKTKVPYVAGSPGGSRAKADDPSTWRMYAQAIRDCIRNECTGIGFELGNDSGYTGLDLDHCVHDGIIEPWALETIEALGSYAEHSPSYKLNGAALSGIRIIVLGKLPPGRRRTGTGHEHDIEMYDTGRFLTLTGHAIDGYGEISDGQAALIRLHSKLFPPKPPTPKRQQTSPSNLDDRELIDLALASKSGDKFRRLMDGDVSMHRDNHSEADLALCSMLAFWTGCDASQMDRIFRTSGLMRDKWDQSRGERTYGQITIETAIIGTSETYTRGNGRPKDSTPWQNEPPPDLDNNDQASLPGIAKPKPGKKKKLRGRPRKRELMTSEYINLFAKWGYSLKLNLLNDHIEINGEQISDVIEAQINTQVRDFGIQHNITTSTVHAKESLITTALKNAYHPIKDYLEGLAWDGADHLGRLSEYFTDKDGCFLRWFGHWIVGAVAKVYDGFQTPMLVLDGPQDLGKSFFARWVCPLPGNHYSGAIYPRDKDYRLRLCDVWIWEVEELGSTTRHSDLEALKAFLTLDKVRDRAPYGHFDMVKPAITSFIGTINSDAGFLVDRTGNRRFLVCGLSKIDWGYADNIDVDQLWAQAKYLYDLGTAWKLTDEEKRERDESNQEYMIDDPVDMVLDKYIVVTGNQNDYVLAIELINLVQSETNMNAKAISMAIASTMRARGGIKKKATVQGKRQKIYRGVIRT